MQARTRPDAARLAAQTWDAVVIGTGLGGLTSALTLAQSGWRVLMVEQHQIPGGYATCFKRKGFTFEVSLHQLPALGEGEPLHTILSELGVMKSLTPIRLPYTLLVRTPQGDLTMGPDYLAQLRRRFPHEAQGLGRLEQLIDKLFGEIGTAMKLSALPAPLASLLARVLTPTLYRYRNATLADCLHELLTDPALRQLVSVQWGYFGLPIGRISATLYLLGWGGFLKQGIYYLKGGSQSLSDAMVERLRELGGEVLLSHRAERVLVERDRAAGVVARPSRGEGGAVELRAPIVISNADPFVTLGQLVPEELRPKALLEELSRREVSSSAFVVYVGLDCPLEQITGERTHALGFFDPVQLDFDEAFARIKAGQAPPMSGLTDYGSVDPSSAPAGKTALALLRTDFMDRWRGLSDAEYDARKQAVTEELLADAERRYPGFRSHVEVLEAATPRTMQRYTGNHDGAFNGFAYTPERVGAGRGGLPTAAPLRGLYLSSAWVGAVSGGFMGCISMGYGIGKQIARTRGPAARQ